MAETHLEVHILLAATAHHAAVDTRVYRPYESGGVLLAADGAMETTRDDDSLGWRALVADASGVLSTIASGVMTRAARPWAAEWAGKLDAWCLAASLGLAPAAVQYIGADCTSATLGCDGGVPSQSLWVDRVRVAFAVALGRGHRGPYVPAQHNTQWSGLLSDLQGCTHDLARPWAWRARACAHFRCAVDRTTDLFSLRRLMTGVPRDLDRLFTQLAAPSVTFVRGLPGDDQTLQAWAWAWALTEGEMPT